MNPIRRLIIPVSLLLAIVLGGTALFMRLEHWSFTNALYYVVTTLSTASFLPGLSTQSRLLTIFIIFVGISTFAYTAGQVFEIIIEGQIVGYRRRKKMEQLIREMKNHYIICGFGRVGHQVAVELAAAKIPYVVVDSKQETAEELAGKNIPYFIGDISNDKILLDAGIKRAKGLIASADSDTANVFVTLSARVLNPGLMVIARASGIEAEEKMKKAGANRVISPYFIAGKRMATLATKPVAVDFLDAVLHSEHMEMEMKELRVSADSTMVGKTLAQVNIRQKSGAFIVAIRKNSGEFNYQPVADTVVDNGDVLVAIGTPKQLHLLQEMMHW